MSDATEHPADRPAEPDADAWEAACAEDLEAQKAHHRATHGPQTGSAADELRKLADAVTDKLAGIQLPGALGPLAGPGGVGRLLEQAKAAVEPVVERHPEVFDHLAAAGSELLAAYRSAVENSERRWTRDAPSGGPAGPEAPRRRGEGPDDEGPAGTERIDLD